MLDDNMMKKSCSNVHILTMAHDHQDKLIVIESHITHTIFLSFYISTFLPQAILQMNMILVMKMMKEKKLSCTVFFRASKEMTNTVYLII